MSLESLYPFLHAGAADLETLLADVARSTAEKVAEIERLRAEVWRPTPRSWPGAPPPWRSASPAADACWPSATAAPAPTRQPWPRSASTPGPVGGRCPALALAADVATLTALANDVGFEKVFARPLPPPAGPTTSHWGCPRAEARPTCCAGWPSAHERGMLTVGLAGYSGGAMAEAAERGEIDHLFVMPSASVHRIQEAQTTTYHVLWELVQRALGLR